jgi:hypothetical protein
MMSVGDKFHAAETNYEEGEAEYDAVWYNYQIVDHSDDVVALFGSKETRDLVLAFLNNQEIPAFLAKPDED